LRTPFNPLGLGGLSTSPGRALPNFAQLGASYWWDFTDQSTLEIDGAEIVECTDKIGAVTLAPPSSLGPSYAAGRAVFNGTTQYMQTLDAGVIALADGNDEAFSIVSLCAMTGVQNGRWLGYSRANATRHAGFGNNATADGYFLSRTSTNTDSGAVTMITNERLWSARFVAGGTANKLQYDSTAIVGPVDQSAAAADPYTHFTVGCRIVNGGGVQCMAGNVAHIVLFNSGISDALLAQCAAFVGR
jgi:hypothetical protein